MRVKKEKHENEKDTKPSLSHIVLSNLSDTTKASKLKRQKVLQLVLSPRDKGGDDTHHDGEL